MKKLIFALVIGITSIFAIAAESSHREYSVSKSGMDLQVIEFTPQGVPHMLCVYARAGYGGGLSCFSKNSL
jgi:hypothetical protein